jgi:DNA helicase HerA-like ATPase
LHGKRDDFVKLITEGTHIKEIILGAAILAGETLGNACKNTSKTLNRHGLIAGATGTGKTKLFRFYLNSYLPLAFQ